MVTWFFVLWGIGCAITACVFAWKYGACKMKLEGTPSTSNNIARQEISAFITELENQLRVCDNVKMEYVIERLQKLSAVA